MSKSFPSNKETAGRSRVFRLNTRVFTVSALLSLIGGVAAIFYPGSVDHYLSVAQDFVAARFSWLYMLLTTGVLVFSFGLALSRYGAIRLGKDEERPSIGNVSWASMLFSAGIGIALLYYGAYEPLEHYASPPVGAGYTPEAARNAVALTFLHWGLHGWSLYALVATALAYFAYRRDMPLSLRSPLQAIFGARTQGWIGDAIDILGILATMVSMFTNVGIGALLLQSGLHYLWHVPATPNVLTIITVVMMLVVAGTMAGGAEKGIAYLSNVNVLIFCVLLLFVTLGGFTAHVFEGLLQNTGDYVDSLFRESLNLYHYAHAEKWLASWTLFYWAWWTAWAPFVGLFIARISRGRTIRELIFGVTLIPLGFTLAWISIFGNTAILLVRDYGASLLMSIAHTDPPMTLFKLLEYLPLTALSAFVTVIASFVLSLTPVNSGALMISTLCVKDSGEGQDAPMAIRLFWVVAIGVISIGLLLAGSFSAMQKAVVLCGLPFSTLLVLYGVGLLKSLREEEASAQKTAPRLP